MKTDRELLEQALEALNLINHRGNNDDELFKVGQTITLIQERLAENDDEPVLWVDTDDNGELYWDEDRMVSDTPVYFDNPIPLYRRPLPMARLTDEEINDCFDIAQRSFHKHQSGIKGQQLNIQDWPNWHFARAIEQKIWGRAE